MEGVVLESEGGPLREERCKRGGVFGEEGERRGGLRPE